MEGSHLIPAAQYLRVSREHQQYSMENQAEVIWLLCRVPQYLSGQIVRRSRQERTCA